MCRARSARKRPRVMMVRAGPPRYRSERLDPEPSRGDPRGRRTNRALQRIFVNAAITKGAVPAKPRADRSWLHKVRPMYGPRLPLPYPHQMSARRQRVREPARTIDERRVAKPADLAYWFKDSVIHPKPPKEPPEAETADDPGAIGLPPAVRCWPLRTPSRSRSAG